MNEGLPTVCSCAVAQSNLKAWYEYHSGLQHMKHENDKEILRIRRALELEVIEKSKQAVRHQ